MTYITTDIHGNKRAWENIKFQIELKPEDHLYILGDVIDRNPYGIEILQEIMDNPQMTLLLGNHEHMMRNAIQRPYQQFNEWHTNMSLWERNGCKPTLEAYYKLTDKEQKRMISYLYHLPVNLDIEVNGIKYKLVHAAPLECWTEHEIFDKVTFAVWDRNSVRKVLVGRKIGLGSIIIGGHTPTERFAFERPMSVFAAEDYVDLDCGAAYSYDQFGGRLACLRLEDMRVFYSIYSREELTPKKNPKEIFLKIKT